MKPNQHSVYPFRKKCIRNPKCMREAPRLDPERRVSPPQARSVLLINPFYAKDPHASFGKHVLTPSLALTSLAGATPSSWSVRYWDENLLQGPPPVEPFPQVVAITVHLTFAKRAFELADWYRERGARVILGGLHVVSCPVEAQPHADAIAIGDGAQLWPQILDDIEKGSLKPIYHVPFRRPFREEPAPRRDILPHESYLTTSSLIATRGCHSRCRFCYLATEGLHIPYQMRDVESVAREFEDNGLPYGVFLDNNLGSRPEYLRQLCRALRPLQKIWSAAVSIDATDDPSLVKEMALAGCTGVFVGFETLSNKNILESRKKSPSTEYFAERVKLLHDFGIQVNGSFVLGFDDDGPEVFQETVKWIERNRLECATFHILTPYPGTPLFRQMKQEGRLLHTNWEQYDTSHVVFRPKRMTPEQLQEGYSWCYKRLFSHASIWRRRPLEARAIPAYLGMSYLYKRCNWLWPFLIRYRLTARMWHPLIELSRRRHVRFRKELEGRQAQLSGEIVAAQSGLAALNK